MVAKILGGLAVAVALTLTGVYAATGTVPGVETLSDALVDNAPAGGCCGQKSACPVSQSACSQAAACPYEGGESATDLTAEPALGCCKE